MRMQRNKTTKKEEWVLDKWYNKAVFIVGMIQVFMIVVSIFRNSL